MGTGETADPELAELELLAESTEPTMNFRGLVLFRAAIRNATGVERDSAQEAAALQALLYKIVETARVALDVKNFDQLEKRGQLKGRQETFIAAAGEYLRLVGRRDRLVEIVGGMKSERRAVVEPEITKSLQEKMVRDRRAGIWLGTVVTRTGTRNTSKSLGALRDAFYRWLADENELAGLRKQLQKFDVNETALPQACRQSPADGDNQPAVADNAYPVAKLEPSSARQTLTNGSIPHDAISSEASALARFILSDLEDQERRLRIADANELPVRWSLVTDHLADHWENVVGSSTGDSAPATGLFGDIGEYFDGIPSGRIVILGKPGSGKTVLAIRLSLELLRKASPSALLVPVIVNAAAWSDDDNDFRKWLVRRITAQYPLRKQRLWSTNRKIEGTVEEMLNLGLLLPIIDGYDAVSPDLRAPFLAALNRGLNRRDKIVLTSRVDEYKATVDEFQNVSAAAVIQIEDLDLAAALDYLHLTGARLKLGDETTTSWGLVAKGVLEAPAGKAAANLMQSMKTPLMVSIARQVYESRKSDAAELLDASRFPDESSINRWLFDQYMASRIPVGSDLRLGLAELAYEAKVSGKPYFGSSLPRHHLLVPLESLARFLLYVVAMALLLLSIFLDLNEVLLKLEHLPFALERLPHHDNAAVNQQRMLLAISAAAGARIDKRDWRTRREIKREKLVLKWGEIANHARYGARIRQMDDVFHLLFSLLTVVLVGLVAFVADVATKANFQMDVVVANLPTELLLLGFVLLTISISSTVRYLELKRERLIDEGLRLGLLSKIGWVYQFRYHQLQDFLADEEADRQN